MQNGSNNNRQTFSFRGRSMQDAVEQLKVHLGVDAVIVSTRRGRDKEGRFVEISARRGDAGQRAATPAVPQGQMQPTGGIRKASAAYAQTAANTRPAPITSRLADITLGDNKDKPFAERAAWLASQIQQRQAEASGPVAQPAAQAGGLPPELLALRTGALPARNGGGAAAQVPIAPSSPHHAPVPHAAAFGELNEYPIPPYSQAADSQQVGGPAIHQAHYGQLSDEFAQAAPRPTAQSAHQRYALQPDVQSTSVQGGPSVPEATSASSRSSHQTSNQETELELARLRRELCDIKAAVAQLSGGTSTEQRVTLNGEQLSAAISSLDEQVGEIRSLLECPVKAEKDHSKHDDILRGLNQLGFSVSHAEEISERMRRALPDGGIQDGDVRDMLNRMIADDLVCGGGLTEDVSRRRMLAFVGPTGVGKTTTIAKVASQARLKGHRVALITVDTFRMAAVEQLARYAEVLNAPLRIARTPESLQATMNELADFDTILIDTTGRSQRCEDQVQALSEYFPSGWGGELVLTLACGMRDVDMAAAIETYGRIGIERLCITKTDESEAIGTVFSAVRRLNRPLTWTTYGQTVPDDIEVAHAEMWSERIVSELIHRSTVAYAV